MVIESYLLLLVLFRIVTIIHVAITLINFFEYFELFSMPFINFSFSFDNDWILFFEIKNNFNYIQNIFYKLFQNQRSF